MSTLVKNQKEILEKLGIQELNAMQKDAQAAIYSHNDTVLLSPTGTGKTLAFLLPIFNELNPTIEGVQAMIIVPSRELALQIEQVAREMGTGYKVNIVYGGRSFNQDKIDLKHPPAVIMGTPGRLADHLRRNTFDVSNITTLVLDEFDKSLEIGFEEEMGEICAALDSVKKRILTSATNAVDIPEFVGVGEPKVLNYLDEGVQKLKIKLITAEQKDKLPALLDTLRHVGNEAGIIFCNFKDTIDWLSDFLARNKIPHGCFYGGMEQKDRERSLIKFRNGTHQLLLATDLAARGLDIPELKFIIHFQLPNQAEPFTHRNGRTARMHKGGTAYVLKWEKEEIPDFIKEVAQEEIKSSDLKKNAEPIEMSEWETLFISGGRRDKISKGDIVGLLCKQGNLTNQEIGIIEVKQDCAFVAVPDGKILDIINAIDNARLKKRKIRAYVV